MIDRRKSLLYNECESRDSNPDAVRRQILSLHDADPAYYRESNVGRGTSSTGDDQSPPDSTAYITRGVTRRSRPIAERVQVGRRRGPVSLDTLLPTRQP